MAVILAYDGKTGGNRNPSLENSDGMRINRLDDYFGPNSVEVFAEINIIFILYF